MADKRIQDLTPAESIQLADRFVLEQAGQAKSLTGQILINDLTTALDGHGGISDITYTPPESGSLDGTLTITMADTTTYDVTVTNGNGIESISVVYGIANAPDPSAVSIWYTSVQTPTDAKPYALTRISMSRSAGDPVVAYTITQKALNPAITVGTVTATEGEEADATVTNSGTAYNPTLNFDFTLPQGEKGDRGYYIEPVTAYAVSTDGTTAPSSWQNSPPNISSGEYLWEKIEYILADPDNPQTLRTVTSVIGYVGTNGTGSGTLTGVTFNGTAGTVDVGTGVCSITATASDVGAIATPANAPLNNQVLTFDSTLNAWTPKTPSTGSVNTVNNVGATAGTTNIQLYATAIPMSSSDSTPVSSAIPQAATTTPANLGTAAVGTATKWAKADHVHNLPSASDVGAISTTDVKFKIYSTVTDIGLTVGSATIAGAFAAMPDNSILFSYWSQFPVSELPGNYVGIVEIIKKNSNGGIVYFHGQTDAYGEGVMHLNSSNVPDGTWVHMTSNDMFVVETKSKSVSVSANTGQSTTINVAKSGYTAIGVVGFSVTDTASANNAAVNMCYLSDSTTVTMQVRNTSGTDRTWTFYARVLYIKN